MEFLQFIYPFIRFAKLSFSKFVKITFRAELKLVANFRTIVFTVPVTTVKGFCIALFKLFSVKDFVKIEQFCFVHQKAELYRFPALLNIGYFGTILRMQEGVEQTIRKVMCPSESANNYLTDASRLLKKM